jgi:hypothetical protein
VLQCLGAFPLHFLLPASLYSTHNGLIVDHDDYLAAWSALLRISVMTSHLSSVGVRDKIVCQKLYKIITFSCISLDHFKMFLSFCYKKIQPLCHCTKCHHLIHDTLNFIQPIVPIKKVTSLSKPFSRSRDRA